MVTAAAAAVVLRNAGRVAAACSGSVGGGVFGKRQPKKSVSLLLSPLPSPSLSLRPTIAARRSMRSSSVPDFSDISRPGTSACEPLNVAIVGSGPAAHTAAIYAARANLKPVLFEGFMAGGIAPGGQLTTTTVIENFPGWPEGIQGSELMQRMRAQSEECGTKIITQTVSRSELDSWPYKLYTEDEPDEPVYAKTIIVATGATAKRLYDDLPGDGEFWNKGVSACAVCDGPAPIFRNKPIAVLGGGDSACEEAIHLTKYASKVYMIVRRNKMRASMVMQKRVCANFKIEILWNTVPVRLIGGSTGTLHEAELECIETKKRSTIQINGFFYAIGHKPNTDMLSVSVANETGKVQVDNDGYVICKPGCMETNVPGVFAAGDVQDKKYRQAITAAGMGCRAALECIHWLEVHGETGPQTSEEAACPENQKNETSS